MTKFYIYILLWIIIVFPDALAEEMVKPQFQRENAYNESFKIDPANNFKLSALLIGGKSIDNTTNIAVTKKILPTEKKNSPAIELTLKMPPKPAKIDIVLAMDTSGSMIQHYQKNTNITYMEWASNTISDIIESYPEARVSIVSWDDENQEGDRISPFYDISKNPSAIERELSRLHLECIETDHTIYSIGLKRAIDTLDNQTRSEDNQTSFDPYNTARIIIFVTGLSEFLAEPNDAPTDLTLAEQLSRARENRSYNTSNSFNGYQVYTVHIGIDERFKMEYDNLTKISEATRIPNQPALPPIAVDDIEDLGQAINSILTELKSRPVANNVEVTDTLYPYLLYDRSVNNWSIPVNYTKNNDDSATLKWIIGTMRGNDTWTAIIYSRLMLNLPVDVAERKKPVGYNVSNSTPISEVRYRWMTGYDGILELPGGEILSPPGNFL